jgi:putative flippase GtrA
MVRWGIKSVGGLLANLALLTLWVDVVGFAAWWAIGINWILVSLVGYVVTDRWVFANGESATGLVGNIKRYIGMQGVMSTGKAANYVIYLGLLSVVDYRIAWTVGAIVTFAVTFAGNRWLWVSDSPAL